MVFYRIKKSKGSFIPIRKICKLVLLDRRQINSLRMSYVDGNLVMKISSNIVLENSKD
jgi:hypothetical protein